MEDSNQSPEQKEAWEESLKRGQAFEELIRNNGWKYVQAWYQAKIQLFASSLLIEDKKSIAEFENERRELIGIRKLLGVIENDLRILRESYKKNEENKRPSKE